jgi:hypothetical protein
MNCSWCSSLTMRWRMKAGWRYMVRRHSSGTLHVSLSRLVIKKTSTCLQIKDVYILAISGWDRSEWFIWKCQPLKWVYCMIYVGTYPCLSVSSVAEQFNTETNNAWDKFWWIKLFLLLDRFPWFTLRLTSAKTWRRTIFSAHPHFIGP